MAKAFIENQDARDEIAFNRVFAGTRCIPRAAPHQLEWAELPELRNHLNSAISAGLGEADDDTISSDEEITGATRFASQLLDQVQSEMNHRDHIGDRSPRKSSRKSDLAPPGSEGPQAHLYRGRSLAPAGAGGELVAGRKHLYAAMFGQPRDNGGFKSLNEYLAVVGSGRYDDRLRIMDSSMSEGVGADGGFLVPDYYVRDLFDASLEAEIVRPRATVVPMLGRTAIASGFDTENHTGGSIGGFVMEWLGELATGTRQKAKVRRIQLTAKKGAIFTQASNELAADAPGFDGDLVNTLVQAIGWSLDYYAIRGTGAGQPLGVLNDPALITVAAEGGQAADSFVAQNVLKMFSRLHPACIKSAVWITSSTCLPKLMSLYIPATNIAGTENVGAVTGPLVTITGPNQYLMLGLPLIVTEKASAVGDVGDLVLADFSQYVLGIRREVTVERSNAAGWLEDASDWRAIIRFDGQGKWSGPVTPVKGGETLSWAVTLAAR